MATASRKVVSTYNEGTKKAKSGTRKKLVPELKSKTNVAPSGKQTEAGSADAAELQQLLRKNFEPSSSKEEPAKKASSKKPTQIPSPAGVPASPEPAPQVDEPEASSSLSPLLSLLTSRRSKQVIKTLIGILLIVAAGWVPAARLFQVSSVEAIINARVVTVRSPIEGVIEFKRNVNNLYDVLPDGAMIARVENQRINTGKSNDLRKQIGLELIELDRVDAERESLLRRKERLIGQVEQYRSVRLKELQTRLDEAAANQNEIEAKLARARAQQERSSKLFEKELVAAGNHDDIQSEVAILGAGLERVKAQRRRVELEHKTLSEGGFFGDNFNDRIRPAKEIDETDDMLSKTDAQLVALAQRVASLKYALIREDNSVFRLQVADIALPVTGQLWETLVADGEQVSRGQPLLRMLDCKNVLVTTAVSEEVYNRLAVGDGATFILRESGLEFAANVKQLSGVSSASANLAILPSALEKEPYRATVLVPELGTQDQCLLGKTGRVVFDVKA